MVCTVLHCSYRKKATPDDLITMSEAVYNFQRIFNLKMGFGRRKHDHIPYRAMGPVTVDEYESRQERYDEQLVKKYGVDITGKSSEEKVALCADFAKNSMKNFRMRFISAGDGPQMASPQSRP